MKRYIAFLVLLIFFSNTLHSANSQDDVKVAIIGKLSHFIKWENTSQNENFIITILRDTDFKNLLEARYSGGNMNSKKVLVKHIEKLDDIKRTDILYVSNLSHKEQYKVSAYAKENSILTLSQEKGFAQRGGVIQLYFVAQKIKLKINHQAAKKTGLKISSTLLAISTIVKGKEL